MIDLKFRLSEIRIKNFLSYKDATFTDLKNYNVIIGKNNAGKSNLFKILDFLKQNAKKRSFNNSYLYDESIDIEAKVSLTFELSHSFRYELFEILYDRGYLQIVFITHEGEEGYLSRNQWNKKEVAVEWLCTRGFFNFIKITIEYYKEYNNLVTREIKYIHNDFEEEQLSYEGIEKGRTIESVIHRYSKATGRSVTFNTFFTKYSPQKANDLFHDSIHNLITKTSRTIQSLNDFNPILQKIIFELFKTFLSSINVIPYDRQFRGKSDRSNIRETELDLNGVNFVKFIDKLISIDNKEWVDDLNNELKHYFNDVKELTKTVDSGDQAILILKEYGLLSKLRKENMGAGILNITFFLTWIKLLKNNQFLFIEEPELFVYPGLQKKILEKFLDVSNDIQIFVTTHSKYFLCPDDKICSVYFLQKVNNASIPYKIPKEDFPEIYKNLEIVLEEYEQDQVIIYNDDFWNKFIAKAMIREEDQLWDFKQTLEMWKAPDLKVKEKKTIEFCEDITAFANADGGIILLGITNNIPRKIVGLEKIEERKTSIPKTLKKFTNLKLTSCIIRDIHIKGENNEKCKCLAIIIPQTKDVIEVKGLDNKISFPIRIGAGLDRVDYKTISEAKINVYRNNFKFIHKLLEFSNTQIN